MCDKMNITTERLRNLIDKTGQTREYIAQNIGCDTSMVTKHYNGSRNITVDYVVKYAKHFSVSTDYLLGLTNAETTDKDIRYICDYTGLTEDAVILIKTSFEHVTPICQVINTLSKTTEGRNILYSTFAQVGIYKKTCIEATNRIKEVTPTNYESCNIVLDKKELERYKAENSFRDLLNYFTNVEEEYIKQNRYNYDCIAIDKKLEKLF